MQTREDMECSGKLSMYMTALQEKETENVISMMGVVTQWGVWRGGQEPDHTGPCRHFHACGFYSERINVKPIKDFKWECVK